MIIYTYRIESWHHYLDCKAAFSIVIYFFFEILFGDQ